MGFSSSKQSSTSNSSNQAFPIISNAFSGVLPSVSAASSSLSALLGGDNTGLKGYQAATGFNPQLNYGFRGVTGAQGAGGLLNSGSTGKSLMNYGQMLSNQSAQNYIANLLGFGNLGIGAGGVLAGSGQVSNSSSKGSGKGIQLPTPVPGG